MDNLADMTEHDLTHELMSIIVDCLPNDALGGRARSLWGELCRREQESDQRWAASRLLADAEEKA